MKDECGGNDIVEFVGLKPKSYSYKTASGKVEKKCKGVKQYVVKNHITIDDYRECLFSKQPQFRTMNTIRSRQQHNVMARIILADGIKHSALWLQRNEIRNLRN